MSVSQGFREFVAEQLAKAGSITTRSMFGGVGVYSDGVFFGIIDNDRLYLKVDDINRPEYEAHGMEPFRPYDDDRTMPYYEIPVDVLENPDELAGWALKAVDVARRAKRRKR